MRPIDKGEHPILNGIPVTLVKYSRGRRFLINRIGEYCSYCERKIAANLAVEHVQPKSLEPQLELEWSNFLLGCTNCNSTKGNRPVNLPDFFWPDIDNTFEAFSYDESGIVRVNPNLSHDNQERANRTIALVGLDKGPPTFGTVEWMEASDRRFEHRVKAFEDANRYSSHYANSTAAIRTEMIPFIIDVVEYSGFWSIWMHAFEGFQEVQEALIGSESHAGTNQTFF